jgi:uncharacterized membrane protein
MPGPFSSDHRGGAAGPPFTDTHPSEPIPAPPPFPTTPPAAVYPGPVPPPMPYPKRRRRPLLIGIAVALLVIAVIGGAILYTTHRPPAPASGAFTDATATTAIQGYLDALENRDTESIARNALCGIYDSVRDRRADEALAKLSSDAFRKQFSQAKVTTIDKIVYWSDYQAQVLFSMHIQPSSGSSSRSEVQAVAQLLSQHNRILVCSYVMRTSGLY